MVVVRDGEPDLGVMPRERLSLDDFMGAARQQGIETFAAIRLAILETNGQISFFATGQDSQGAPQPPDAG